MTCSRVHFVKETVASAGISTPWVIDPRPSSYIGRFRDDFRDLDYSPHTRKLRIEDKRGVR